MTGNDDLDRYRIFLKQQEYQDKLFWSRVQTLYLVQAAVLGSSFAIRDRWFGWAILGIGAVISTLVALLCCYDWQDSQANKTSMDALGNSLRIFRGVEHVGIRKFIPGNRILQLTMLLFIWLDVGLACGYFWGWFPTEPLAKSIGMFFVGLALFGGSAYFWRFWSARPPKPS